MGTDWANMRAAAIPQRPSAEAIPTPELAMYKGPLPLEEGRVRPRAKPRRVKRMIVYMIG
jgi:hypothetical protein